METTRGFKVGSFYRLYAISPNTVRRRQLLSEDTAGAGGRRKLRAAAGEGAATEDDRSLVAKLFEDPALQAALNASFVAESQLDALVEKDPGRVPAQWYEPNATNPLGMDPWLLAAARYAAMAILTDRDDEPDRAPAVALDGTLDAYLYGGCGVWRGEGHLGCQPATALQFFSELLILPQPSAVPALMLSAMLLVAACRRERCVQWPQWR